MNFPYSFTCQCYLLIPLNCFSIVTVISARTVPENTRVVLTIPLNALFSCSFRTFWFVVQMSNVYSFAVWQVRPIWLFQRWACLERQLSDAPTLQVSVRVGVPRIQQGTGTAWNFFFEKLKNEVKLVNNHSIHNISTLLEMLQVSLVFDCRWSCP